MPSYMWRGGVGASGAAVALISGLLCAASAARADARYTFTLTPPSGSGVEASGVFTLGNVPSPSFPSFVLFTSVDATYTAAGGVYGVDQVIRGSNVRTDFGGYSVSALFLGPGASLSFTGTPTITNGEIRGTVRTIYSNGSGFVNETSLFDAVPSSGGGSGGVPAPEVNAALSLALVGATLALLRRTHRRCGDGGAI